MALETTEQLEQRLEQLETMHTTDEMLIQLAQINAMYGMEQTDLGAFKTNGFLHFVLSEQYASFLYRSNMAIQENHVITARRLSSMYKHAASHDIYPVYSIPATIDLLLIFDENKYYLKADRVGNAFRYVISKEHWITVGNFRYSFDYDIEIKYQYLKDKDPNITVNYIIPDSDDERNPMSDITHPYIKYTRIKDSKTGRYNTMIYLTLKQYYKKRIVKSFENREYDSFYAEAPNLSDEICNLEFFWESTSTSSTQKLTKLEQRMYFEPSRSGEAGIFLKYTDTNRAFELIHKASIMGYTPLVGDQLYIDLYLTRGKAGNFTRAKIKDTDIQFKINNDYDNGLVFNVMLAPSVDEEGRGVSTITASVGGMSFDETVESLRKQVIVKRSTRDSIMIENDLLMKLNERSTINEYSIVKFRNDCYERLFNIFTIIRFQQDNDFFTIPTNTLNVIWNITDNAIETKSGQYLIKTRMVSSSEHSKGIFEDVSDPNFGDPGSPTEGKIPYILPFTILFDKNKDMVRVYDAFVDEFRRPDNTYRYDEIPYNYIINKINFKKEDRLNDYKMIFEVRTTLSGKKPLELIHSYDPITGDIIDEGFLDIQFEIYDQEDNFFIKKKAVMVAYNDGSDTPEDQVADDYYTYEILFHKANELIIADDSLEILDDDDTINPRVFIPMDLMKGRITINAPTTLVGDVLVNDRKDVEVYEFNFRIMNNRSADHKIQPYILNENEVQLYNIPLVGYKFYNAHKERYRSAIMNEYAFLRSILMNYQGEFSYSIKYANTYGYSKSYVLTNFNGATRNLNNVMLDMSFLIQFASGFDVSLDTLNSMIYDYVNAKDFVKLDSFHISDLTEGIKNAYHGNIPIFQFGGMNNIDASYELIQMNIKEITNDIVIEKLNIPFTYDEVTKKFSHSVRWTLR